MKKSENQGKASRSRMRLASSRGWWSSGMRTSSEGPSSLGVDGAGIQLLRMGWTSPVRSHGEEMFVPLTSQHF